MNKKNCTNKENNLISHPTIVEKLKENLKWRREHPKLAKLQDVWWWIRYGIKNKVIEFPREVKYFIQRGRRGYSQRDIWGFDYYLAKVISGGIDSLIKELHGYPGSLKNFRQWKIILRKIQKTFVTAVKISDNDKVMTKKENKEYLEGWQLFSKYFNDLWD